MRCPKETFIKDEIFHIYNRTINPFLLFRERDDYLLFLKAFKTKMQIYPAVVFAYCLMPNHFHFLIRQGTDKPVYRIFNDTLSSYVRHYNFKYQRKGSLFEGHLQYINVKTDRYLAYLCQYIHNNPQKAGIVETLEDWEFSNYLEWIGIRKGKLFDDEILKTYFENADNYKETIHEHERYVEEQQFVNLLLD